MINKKGISMITLAVTVLVMIILAGVVIIALSDGGIIDKASNTVTGYNDRGQAEGDIVNRIEDQIENELGGSAGNPGNTNTPPTPSTPNPPQEIGPQVLKDVITSANYGDAINYSANGLTNWKVFYNDGTNVFIIASDYMPNAHLPENALMGTHADYPNSAYWPDGSVYLNNVVGAADIDTNIASKFMLGWLSKYPTSTNQNIKAIATMMDQEVWGVFVANQYADSAIASPTYEMFANSWNQKYPTSAQIYCDLVSDVGYYVTTTAPADRTEAITAVSTNLSDETGYADTLYFPHTSTYNNSNGYWLASPSTFVYQKTQSPQYVYQTGEIGASAAGCCSTNDKTIATADFALRPVVCLNTAVKATKTSSGWILE